MLNENLQDLFFHAYIKNMSNNLTYNYKKNNSLNFILKYLSLIKKCLFLIIFQKKKNLNNLFNKYFEKYKILLFFKIHSEFLQYNLFIKLLLFNSLKLKKSLLFLINNNVTNRKITTYYLLYSILVNLNKIAFKKFQYKKNFFVDKTKESNKNIKNIFVKTNKNNIFLTLTDKNKKIIFSTNTSVLKHLKNYQKNTPHAAGELAKVFIKKLPQKNKNLLNIFCKGNPIKIRYILNIFKNKKYLYNTIFINTGFYNSTKQKKRKHKKRRTKQNKRKFKF